LSNYRNNRKDEKNPVNQNIKAEQLRVIDQKGGNLGVLKKDEALKKAQKAKLDLVVVANNAEPPVAKIMNHGKYQYQQQKKQTKSAKSSDMKEIRLTINIEEHDFNTRIKQAQKFLKNNHPVKISMILHGREQAFPKQARSRIKNFIRKLNQFGKIDQDIKKEGRNLYAIIKPN